VMLNVEADITIGRHLAAEAKSAGVVYTGAAATNPRARWRSWALPNRSGSKSWPPERVKTTP
ncbi:hypothetical protein, partial [Paracoccus versutus]|uniref:hypothetical protein n=1 Tax=Paracoccus versutus TaxID=34007 RepID=UPI001AD81E32